MPAAPPATRLISGGTPTIYVSDMRRAVEFYTKTLGLGVLFDASPHFAMLDAGDGLKLGLHPAGSNSPRPGARGATELGLNVAQPIETVVTELQSRGVTFTNPAKPILDDGPVKLAYFTDPDGNLLYLCQVGA